MTLLVTGATGLIGTALVARLSAQGHEVVPLRRGTEGQAGSAAWDPPRGRVLLPASTRFDGVIHLAGENVAQRWTPAAKARIRASRVDATRLLSETLASLTAPPRVLVCASAIGFYGDRGEEVLDETSGPGVGYLPELVRDWEAAAAPALARGIRVAHLRLGVVLTARGGALRAMLPVFRLGLGGRVGGGRQYWSWIALADVLGVIERALEDDRFQGPVNTVAPEAATNAAFTAALARALRRPAFLPLPALAVRCVFGEMGQAMLLASARVRPARLLEAGVHFQHPALDAALRHLLAERPAT